MLAILYDIHGNLPALEAVLADARLAGAQRILLGGDYALMGPYPAETVKRLRTLNRATWIRGNTERWLADPSADDIPDSSELRAGIAFARRAVGYELVNELAALDDTHVSEGALFCHASPGSDMVGFTDLPSYRDGELLDRVREGTLICGHTHVQFRRQVGRVEVINPGSVGMPFDGDQRAAYALRDGSGMTELRRVEYPVDDTLAALTQHDADWARLATRRITNAAP